MTTSVPTLGYYFRYNGDETLCVVYNPQDKTELAHGHATRFHKDRPDKRIARKVAFTNAVNAIVAESNRAVS